MALIECPECSRQVSDKANSCPNCGYPLTEMTKEPVLPPSKEEPEGVRYKHTTKWATSVGVNPVIKSMEKQGWKYMDKVKVFVGYKVTFKKPAGKMEFINLKRAFMGGGVLLIILVIWFGRESHAPPTKKVTRVASEPKVKKVASYQAKMQTLPDLPTLEKEVVINVEVTSLETGKPIVRGTTNLPDGTKLMVSVESKALGLGCLGQGEAVVRGNRFSAGPFFSNKGNKLKVGGYVAEVVMPIPAVQPDSVRAVIGAKGEKLKGKLVDKGDYDWGVTVKATKDFIIGSDSRTALAEEKARARRIRAEAESIYNALNDLLRKGKSMDNIRKLRELSDYARCGDLMRAYQSEVKQLQKRIEQLPPRKYPFLKAAAIDMELCVSCSQNAAKYSCKNARASLNEAKQNLVKDKDKKAEPTTPIPKASPPQSSKPETKPRPKPTPVSKPRPRIKKAYGFLDINALPTAYLYIDGVKHERTLPALGIKLTAGEHRLRLVNPYLGLEKELTVEIKKDQTIKKIIDLRQ